MRKAILGVALVLLAAPVFAATITNNANIVRATVANVCIFVTPFDLNFGAYDPVVANSATPLDANAPFTIRCTVNAAVTIDMNQGSNPTGVTPNFQRNMILGANRLMYNLYQVGPATNPWGTVTAGTTLALTGTGANQAVTVYGRIPPAQVVPAGSYSDTVTVSVTF